MSLPEGTPAVALRRRVLSLADTKRILGIRYSDWLLGAPSIEDGIACSGMAQDEWGHSRLLYSLFKEWDEDPTTIEQDREADAWANAPALDEPLAEWTDVVAAMYLIDGALSVALQSFGGTGFAAAEGRTSKMLDEERYHSDLAAAWLRRLAAGTAEGRAALRSSLERVLPSTLAWLAPDDDLHGELADAGIDANAETLKAGYHEVVRPGLEAVDLSLPDPDRGGWDMDRGRGPGAPDADAVERARGLRNRALFVE